MFYKSKKSQISSVLFVMLPSFCNINTRHKKIWSASMKGEKMIIIGRPILGVTLNGLEYVLDDEGDLMNFTDK